MNFHPDLLREARKSGFLLAVSVLSGALGGFLAVQQARSLTRLIAAVFLHGQTLSGVRPVLFALLLVILLRAASVFLGGWSSGAAAVAVKNRLRARLFEKIQRIGPARLGQERSGELVSTAVQGVEALDAYISQYLPQAVLAAVVPLIILVSVFPLDGLSGLVLLLTAPLIPVFMVLIGGASETLTRRQFTALSRMSGFFLDTLQGLATLKALGQSENQAARMDRVSLRYRDTTMIVLRVTFLSALVLEWVGTLSTAVIAVQIGLRLLYGQIGFEQAFFILVIAPDFYLPLRQLGLRFHAGMAGVSAARRIYELLNQPEAESASPAVLIAPSTAPLHIIFAEVRYTYPGRAAGALDGISFELRAGDQLALVGETGSGKSTVASLLLKFIAPQSGRITVNGRDLSDYDPDLWRAGISLVPQRPYLYADTIAGNLRLARPGAGLDEIRRAADLAGLDEFIRSLPDGYETRIGEGGSRLSGGQAQRLALARAFLRDAPLLILDEPTAHLDAAQEEQIQRATRRLRAGRTVLVIAHRLPTVMEASRILVLQAGRVVEAGSHAGLSVGEGWYARMLQAYRGVP